MLSAVLLLKSLLSHLLVFGLDHFVLRQNEETTEMLILLL